MTLPPSCFTAGTEFLGLEASPLPLQAYLLSLWPNSSIFMSSDHKSLRKWSCLNWGGSLIVHLSPFCIIVIAAIPQLSMTGAYGHWEVVMAIYILKIMKLWFGHYANALLGKTAVRWVRWETSLRSQLKTLCPDEQIQLSGIQPEVCWWLPKASAWGAIC